MSLYESLSLRFFGARSWRGVEADQAMDMVMVRSGLVWGRAGGVNLFTLSSGLEVKV